MAKDSKGTTWENANIILVYEMGDVKELKNYQPISVVCKLFTK